MAYVGDEGRRPLGCAAVDDDVPLAPRPTTVGVVAVVDACDDATLITIDDNGLFGPTSTDDCVVDTVFDNVDTTDDTVATADPLVEFEPIRPVDNDEVLNGLNGFDCEFELPAPPPNNDKPLELPLDGIFFQPRQLLHTDSGSLIHESSSSNGSLSAHDIRSVMFEFSHSFFILFFWF